MDENARIIVEVDSVAICQGHRTFDTVQLFALRYLRLRVVVAISLNVGTVRREILNVHNGRDAPCGIFVELHASNANMTVGYGYIIRSDHSELVRDCAC